MSFRLVSGDGASSGLEEALLARVQAAALAEELADSFMGRAASFIAVVCCTMCI